jgi:hypothetical protein
MKRTFYTYLWLRDNGTPFYVGKGQGRRAFVKHVFRNREMCPPPKDRIILQEFPNEYSALEAEIFLISFYGRRNLGLGCLRNMSDGGENPPNLSGHKHSAEYCRRVSVAKRAKKHRHTPEAKLRMSEARKGKGLGKRPLETGRKISIAMAGKPKSEEHRRKLSESTKAYFRRIRETERN